MFLNLSWFFNHGFKFDNSVCNCSDDLVMLCLNINNIAIITVNPIKDGLFRGFSRMGGPFRSRLPKIHHTYHTMMKLGIFIFYLKEIQKRYKLDDTFLESY